LTSGSAVRLAIGELEAKLDQLERDVRDTKMAINVLLGTLGERPKFADLADPTQQRTLVVAPDQYFRKPITKAAREYLQARKGAAPVEDIIAALQSGGCDLGAYPLKNVKISLSKNSRIFASVSENVFGLWEFYGGSPKKRTPTASDEADSTELGAQELSDTKDVGSDISEDAELLEDDA
jgi:hypothetical protein